MKNEKECIWYRFPCERWDIEGWFRNLSYIPSQFSLSLCRVSLLFRYSISRTSTPHRSWFHPLCLSLSSDTKQHFPCPCLCLFFVSSLRPTFPPLSSFQLQLFLPSALLSFPNYQMPPLPSLFYATGTPQLRSKVTSESLKVQNVTVGAKKMMMLLNNPWGPVTTTTKTKKKELLAP